MSALLVVRVVDDEAAGDADRLPVAAQDPGAEGVERARLDVPAGRLADERDDPLAQLAGGPVREGDGEDLPGRHAADADELGDPMGEHAGLARAGPGEDEERAVGRGDRARLLRVEVGRDPRRERLRGRDLLGRGGRRRPRRPARDGSGASSATKVGSDVRAGSRPQVEPAFVGTRWGGPAIGDQVVRATGRAAAEGRRPGSSATRSAASWTRSAGARRAGFGGRAVGSSGSAAMARSDCIGGRSSGAHRTPWQVRSRCSGPAYGEVSIWSAGGASMTTGVSMFESVIVTLTLPSGPASPATVTWAGACRSCAPRPRSWR